MLNRIQSAATTMFASPRISFSQRAARVFGTGLLGLVLSAPLSWAQLGGVNPPQPSTPTPPPSSELVFAASIIAPESGQVVDQDCFRLNTETGAFRAESLSAQGLPDGYWNVVGAGESTALFTAYMTALGTTDDGQTVSVTISFGGAMSQNGGAGAIVISDGTPLAYEVQANPNCAVPTGSSPGGRASTSVWRLGDALYGN
jgi:hypothetical protein